MYKSIMSIDNKTIMIFGAGINQLELIREAKKLGVIIVAIDPLENPPGKEEADYFYQVAGSDYETTKSIAFKHNVNGIVTGQMEKPMLFMAKLAEELGLIFHSVDVTERCLDKWEMKKKIQTNSIPCARGILLKSGDELFTGIPEGFSFPLIIKPRDSFSSRGVYKTNTLEELRDYLKESRRFASNGDVIMEEFIDGKEYSVETITYKGKTTIIQFTEKFITPYPNTVEMGHIQPAELNVLEKKKINGTVIDAINALGINNSAAHTEVMVRDETVFIIEVGARLGGDFISSYLTKSSTGVSMDRAAIQVALGFKPDVESTRNDYSMISFLELPVGKKVFEILPLDDIYSMPGVVFAYIFTKPNDIIMPITHSALRSGCIIVKAKNKHDAIELAKKNLKKIADKIILE